LGLQRAPGAPGSAPAGSSIRGAGPRPASHAAAVRRVYRLAAAGRRGVGRSARCASAPARWGPPVTYRQPMYAPAANAASPGFSKRASQRPEMLPLSRGEMSRPAPTPSTYNVSHTPVRPGSGGSPDVHVITRAALPTSTRGTVPDASTRTCARSPNSSRTASSSMAASMSAGSCPVA
jgi:hypothetical protein